MKKTIRTTAVIFAGMVITMSLMVSACKKDPKNGAQGPAGAAGATGNANVQQYDFGSMTLNAANSYAATYSDAAITAALLDSSAIFVYYSEGSNQWNVAGGCGPGCNYQTILYTDPTPYVSVYLRNAAGASYSGADVTWVKSRVIIIEANVFRMSSASGSVDYRNYESVKNYFNLSNK